ncbi:MULTISPECIES: hypothetical protein [Kitasatospora]|uniref:Uncharacterized protein n=1 Tax=Kitasatospora setae (strain ATCC 33774 / DSM 43861 / JCM 3304 / KCC A-0304 / NBRC 14216 / KM-6054) TaxID=452652 RepID=E4N972_KITSK|nr:MULTISPECIES: hypothetical protein [Kitasatospora]BAJ27753.1 hypothetical protein KSE_19290 [Kitasatospora setae KM-6054]
MDETDLAGARDGFRAGAAGAAIGTGIALAAWALSALFGDGAFPAYLLGPLLMPASSFIAPLWRERPGHRRPATLVSLTLCLLFVVAASTFGGLLDEGPDHAQTGWSGVLYLLTVLLAATAFGTLAGPPGAEPGRDWLRFAGRDRRYHLAVYGGLTALAVLVAGGAIAFG